MSSKTKTTATKEEAKPEMVPKLRFPEFRGAEGWEPKRLGLALKFQAGFPFPSAGFNDAGKGLRLIRNRDLRSDDIVKFYSEDFDPNFVVNNGDVLVGMDGDFTPTVWEKGEALLNQRVGRILPRGDNDHRFLLYLLTLCLKGIEEATARTTVKHLSHSAVEDRHEPLPSPAEQQKIAECLSSVDELMAAQARKVDALKTHKKGLMQQLFPREGETQPRLRFPEFQNTGEWVRKTVGDVSEVLMCKRIFADETNPNEGVPFYKIGTLGGVPDAFISREKFEDYKSRYNYPRKNEVLITCSGTVGKCLPFDGKDAYFQDSNIVWLDNPTGEVSNEFLLMLLSNVNWGRLNSTTITRIYGPDLRGMAIKYPEDEDEQQRIASCLISLDALITSETQKLEALKTHKNGLMQQLFPSPEAVEA
ncbi:MULTISPECIES: restriction endonuclease subunit S [Acidithiobacillus]|uniref:Type I restriction modification DNA specificity domain-containing protein n=2 Tax=Acidithiobacillus TaxID=119977 RepID=A0A179BGY2_ACIFR|nr:MULTISPECIES: restriction endonuclease subunit S [Acidithiobacillus]MEB8487718.1 restriction endonuclease subunit S [Acidithiobacillus ferriphilus]MEB8489168.1 restriction endonuclease subunit S [Acidithiobacillus ferriphilus]MEB8494568.1 restriction endonuclease subunit S [Acidithiobacillus ferriphilus]MEB8515107.1 restriction endonuclease subunit S [Acidithiobacillus ferriphilus]MEB8519939.1 restriction endonuclease subunit S [Acidithiobacillus ferriphilus]